MYIYIYICNHENNVPSRLSPQCMSCHKAIVVITGRGHCFHDYIYITYILHIAPILLL